ncbi:hypothetical protein [Brachybacterium massiliense]|uniref:hypothetical protein n=1 Tax=Brachybacterium massiliense TaxID=1755098 RepID=UPI001BAFB909|nr:hypothetical protein [Brachybacterium massiliense]
MWSIRSGVAHVVEPEASFALPLDDPDPLPHVIEGGAHLVWQLLAAGPLATANIVEELVDTTGAARAVLDEQVPLILDQLSRLRLVDRAMPGRGLPGDGPAGGGVPGTRSGARTPR